MKLSTIFTVNAILSLLFGLGFLLAPAMQLTSFGAVSSAAAELIARTYGGGLLGLALMSWLARGAEMSAARSAIVWGFVVQHANWCAGAAAGDHRRSHQRDGICGRRAGYAAGSRLCGVWTEVAL